MPAHPPAFSLLRGLIVAGLLALARPGATLAREIRIAGPEHLADLAAARPGDVVILRDGNWPDVRLDLTRGGEETRPILIRAETPGGVVFSGSSVLVLAAPYVTVEGLLFRNGAIARGAVVWFKSDHDTVRDCAIIDYNPVDFRTAYQWVLFSGSSNRLERCYFRGKNNLHALVENGEPNALHNVVAGCHFKDIPLRTRQNGREIVKVLGVGHVNASAAGGAYCTLEGNLFEHADGEGVEVISLKSNFNRVLRNTLVASVGSLNIRRGSDNEIGFNVILGQGVAGAQGIRMAGARNVIHDNFISGCDYGIAVSSGEYWARPLTPAYEINDRAGSAENKAHYPQNRQVLITQNVTLAITGADLDLGVREYKKHWPANQNVLLPEDCRVENNVFLRPQGGISVIGQVPDPKPPLDQFSFQPNHYAGNLLRGGRNSFAPAASGCQELPFPADFSEEKTLAPLHPLTAADVGPAWVRARRL